MPVTRGQGAVVRIVQETVPGTTPTNPAFLLFSKETRSVSFFLDKDKKESEDMGNVDVIDLFSTRDIYGFSVEFVLYDADLVFDMMERQANNTPRPYSAEIIPDEDATTPAYVRGTGWYPKTVGVSGGVGEPYVVTTEFEGGAWADPTTSAPSIGSGSRQTPGQITATLKHFSGGAILMDGVAWATVVNSFEITVDHQTEVAYTTGSTQPVAAATGFGIRKVTGSADISLDGEIKTQWDLVKAFAAHTIMLPFGSQAGDREWTIGGVKFPRLEAKLGTDVKVVMGSQKWQASASGGATVLVETEVGS